jgi:putative transposase
MHKTPAKARLPRAIELLEGHAQPDHIQVVLSIPSKYGVANTMGFLKGKSAVRVHRELMKHRRMTGLHFWADGYCVSTVGLDEETIRKYVRDRNLDQQEFDLE